MSNLKCIECNEAQHFLEQGALILDIRDTESFNQGHPSKAQQLTNDNVQQLLQTLDSQQHILVLCYHGISSQSAAQFIAEQGFSNTYSVNGGFSAWQSLYPDDVVSS